MNHEESFVSDKSFRETSQYLRTIFFPKLKPFIAKALTRMYDENANPRTDILLPLPPEIEVDEPKKFVMVKAVGARVTLRVEVEEDASGKVWVTAASEANIKKNIIGGVIATVFTCGLAGIVFAPLILFRYIKWKKYTEEALGALKVGLTI